MDTRPIFGVPAIFIRLTSEVGFDNVLTGSLIFYDPNFEVSSQRAFTCACHAHDGYVHISTRGIVS